LTSSFDQKPSMSFFFFAITRILHFNHTSLSTLTLQHFNGYPVLKHRKYERKVEYDSRNQRCDSSRGASAQHRQPHL
jgi:hypothetical protein